MALRHIGRPDDEAEQHNLQAISLAGEGKLDEAIAELSKALRLKPEFAEAHYNMGNALAGQDKSDEAMDHFSEAIRIKPDYAEARNNLGILLAKQGKLDEAIAHFSEAVRINPDFTEAKNNLERALRARDKPQKTSTSYLKNASEAPWRRCHSAQNAQSRHGGGLREARRLA